MRILVACEFSGRVRDAFALRGHDAWSCDLEETEIKGNHFRCDVREVLNKGWDLMIAHPPCTYLCSSGARWWAQRQLEQEAAIEFVKELAAAPIPKIAIENPIGVLSWALRPPEQVVHPYHFGDFVSKATCLWLANLPKLREAMVPRKADIRDDIHRASPSTERSKNRSRTFQGIATAMAEQWG